MRYILNLVLVCLSFILINCNPEDPEPAKMPPTATEKEPAADAHANSPDENIPPSAFPDSAFYRPGEFNNLPYQIMFPRGYDSTKAYPIVIFLHGIDERGTDNQKQLIWGASLFKSDSISRKYPSFVVFPQCPTTNRWRDDSILESLKGLIDHLVNTKSIDPKRIYIEGLSMGAYGVYAMVAKYPDIFAAAVAISGDGDETKANVMAKAAWKIYGGRKDTIVPATKSEKMAAALLGSGATVSVKIYPNADHVHSWINAFAEPDYCSWIYSRSKD